ncbi:hypothetical protein N7510_006929 [Penicillium lagena]|uniref:uncharacterized protein n=1 Tax=Penicillium lagena TaxID=94218 RepID=UPI00254013F4|nr:uncharacterized protein N7510_006929 [Penicillium lagena]KAJ5610210.1 hypothetical protein N7510_006929 [Penicillium lagena]
MTVPDVAEENKESGSRSIYYHAEFYDLYTSKYLIDPTDTKVYFDQLRAIHNPAVVLDIATGTGRIIQGLIEHGDRLGHNWNQTTLIGLDNSESMIDSARKSIAAPKAGNLTWMLGSAFDLRSALAAMQLPIYAIDLLILSFGTISHFIAEGQCQHFFNEIGKILRPGGGAQLIPSKQHPGITYQEVLLQSTTLDNLYKDRRVITVRDNDSVIEQEEVTTEFGLWTEEMVKQMAHMAGLRSLYQVGLKTEIIWVFERLQ